MKNITIAGRLTRDAEMRSLNSGDPVLNFSVAVDDRQGKEKSTLFFDCSLWGKRGESLSQYLTKGTSVSVSGDLSKREHDGKTYLTIRVSDVTLLGGGKSEGDRDAVKSSGGGSGEGFARSERNAVKDHYGLNDDIPF